jgi:hypothetical protein
MPQAGARCTETRENDEPMLLASTLRNAGPFLNTVLLPSQLYVKLMGTGDEIERGELNSAIPEFGLSLGLLS